MNQRQLISELYRYHENELFMKRYYERHKEFLPEKLFPSDWSSSPVFFDSVFDMENRQRSGDIDGNLNDSLLSQTIADVSITKHPRYATVFLHDHSFFEFIYVYSGTCVNLVDGCPLNLLSGDLCIIPPKVRHSIAVNTDSVILNLAILPNAFQTTFLALSRSNDFLSEYLNTILYSNKYPQYLLFHTGEDEQLSDIILEMMLQQVNRLPYLRHIVSGLFIAFCGYLLQKHTADIEYPEAYYTKSNLVRSVLNYIAQNYSTVTLSFLSSHFHINEQHLSRLISKETGKTYKMLLTEIRMETACRLLSETNLKIHEISTYIGYENPNYFMKVFRDIHGCTPTEYRNRKPENNEGSDR